MQASDFIIADAFLAVGQKSYSNSIDRVKAIKNIAASAIKRGGHGYVVAG